MIFELNKKSYVIIIFVVVTVISITWILNSFVYNKNEINHIKKNEYNSYDSNYITNDKQASIYLSRYYYLLNNDIDEAYKLLEDNVLSDYPNVDSFKKYISKKNISNSKVDRLKYYKKGKYVYYDIIDINNNRIVFKTHGVMNYRVEFK